LSPDDFRLFCELVTAAGRHSMALPNRDLPAIIEPESPIRATFHLFSVN
jgi:hypothetical protein